MSSSNKLTWVLFFLVTCTSWRSQIFAQQAEMFWENAHEVKDNIDTKILSSKSVMSIDLDFDNVDSKKSTFKIIGISYYLDGAFVGFCQRLEQTGTLPFNIEAPDEFDHMKVFVSVVTVPKEIKETSFFQTSFYKNLWTQLTTAIVIEGKDEKNKKFEEWSFYVSPNTRYFRWSDLPDSLLLKSKCTVVESMSEFSLNDMKAKEEIEKMVPEERNEPEPQAGSSPNGIKKQ